ncbi:MAG: hypothetical protein IAE79_07695, partial [Anaerolinea sp.]|nr:hypothetical protein [Anaerolinea sp.]
MSDLQNIMDEYLQAYETMLAQENAKMKAREAAERDELAQKETRLRAWLTETIPVAMVEYATFDGLERYMTAVVLNLPCSFPISFNVNNAKTGFQIESSRTPYRVPTLAHVEPVGETYDTAYTVWDGWKSLPEAIGRAQ